MSMTVNQLHEAIELGDDFLVGRDAAGAPMHRRNTVGRSGPVFIRYPNGGYRAVSQTEATKYSRLSLAAKKLYQARHDPTCANVSGKPPGGYQMVQTPAGVSLRMASRLVDQWKALSPAQQRSLLWRATRNRGTTSPRNLPCL